MTTETNVMLAAATVESGGEDFRQAVRTGKHQLTADEPPALGGKDAGPAPYQLLLASLGACTSITLKMYAARKSWDLGQVTVKLKIFREEELERIERKLTFGNAALTQEQKDKLLEISGKTPVTKTLLRGTKIETSLG